MPQCPICKAAVWVGQKYCPTCTNPLPQAEEEKFFCPQCGIRVASQQEICQSCKVTQLEIAETPATVPTRAWKLSFKVPSIFLGAGLIIVALLWFFSFDKSPEPPQRMRTPQPQAASKQTPPASPIPASATAPSAPAVAAVREPAAPSAPAASSSLEETRPTTKLPRYFVNIEELSVRSGPDMSSPRISILNFKDEVELLDTSGGWGKVRDVKRNIVGWSYMRYLEPVEADGPQAVSQHQASGPKEPEAISAKASENM